VKHRGRQPGFAATLNTLLQLLLETILDWSVSVANTCWKKPKTTDRCFHATRSLKFFELIDSTRQVIC
jgi:hypothetical protein